MKELETLEVSFADKDRRVDGIKHLTNLIENKAYPSKISVFFMVMAYY
jgi:hypothetical protein